MDTVHIGWKICFIQLIEKRKAQWNWELILDHLFKLMIFLRDPDGVVSRLQSQIFFHLEEGEGNEMDWIKSHTIKEVVANIVECNLHFFNLCYEAEQIMSLKQKVSLFWHRTASTSGSIVIVVIVVAGVVLSGSRSSCGRSSWSRCG